MLPGLVLNLDATLVACHSEKEAAAPTYKGGFGFHPLLCFLANAAEALSGRLRPGNADANTAADHVSAVAVTTSAPWTPRLAGRAVSRALPRRRIDVSCRRSEARSSAWRYWLFSWSPRQAARHISAVRSSMPLACASAARA